MFIIMALLSTSDTDSHMSLRLLVEDIFLITFKTYRLSYLKQHNFVISVDIQTKLSAAMCISVCN